jgi:hypothetical protein
MASYFPTATDDPNADPLNAARKLVFSRTLKSADWASTTIATGDVGQEVDKLRRGGDGYLVVHGGRLFEDVGKFRSLDLLSSTPFSSGLQLEYRRRR